MAELSDNVRSFPGHGEQSLVPKMTRLSDVPRRRITWMCKGRLAVGKITVLDGDPGLGKSTVALDMAARLTTGRALPGMTGWQEDTPVTVPRGVVLLSAEDGEDDTIGPRFDIAGGDSRRVITLKMADDKDNEFLPTLGRSLWAIENAIEASNAALLVVDPLMAYLDADVNSNRDQDVRRVFSPIAAMAARTGCAVLVLRHLNKATGMAGIYRGGGSIGIIGGARFGLLAHKDTEDETGQRRFLMVNKVNIGAEELTLVYRLVGVDGTDHARVEWLGESNVTARAVMAESTDPMERSESSEAVLWLEDLLADGPMNSKDVMSEWRKTGHSEKTLRRAKAKLGVKADKNGYGRESVWMWSMQTLPPKSPAPVTELQPKMTRLSADPFDDDA